MICWARNGYIALAVGKGGAFGSAYGTNKTAVMKLALKTCPGDQKKVACVISSFAPRPVTAAPSNNAMLGFMLQGMASGMGGGAPTTSYTPNYESAPSTGGYRSDGQEGILNPNNQSGGSRSDGQEGAQYANP